MVDKSLKEWMWQVTSSGGGGDHEELTQAEYDALTDAEKTNGTVYFITDGVMSKIMYMGNEYAGFSLTTDFDTPVTVTFPFTATSGGILSATVVPSTSSTSYIYVVDNLSTSYRFASSGGLSYQMTIPIVKGRTYSISASSNYAINGTIKFYPFKSVPATGANYIVEQGTSGNWKYRKWSDGTAECWGAVETPRISNSVVGGFYGGVASNIALPSGLFSEIPRVLLNIYDYGSGMFFGTARAVTTSAFNIQALRSDNVASTAKANVFAIGRWK